MKKAVNNHLTKLLQVEAKEKPTLVNLNTDLMKIEKVHNVWSALESTVLDVHTGIVKCRLLTGINLLQANSYKFSKSVVSTKCRCCGLEDEDLAHTLLYCLSLANQRGQSYSKTKSMIISQIGENQWKSLFNNPEKIIKLILDCGWFEILRESKILQSLERVTTEMCYNLHKERKVGRCTV